ncbi:MAG: response regulator [Candidatus Aminicenantes bacterium]|jgi:DNA-binding response OmpR family regulator
MREKILIIDDEKDFAHFVKENLQLISNYTVITASKGKKGIRAALKENPDLILLDVTMSGIDGFEVLKRLKENEKTHHIPVIMLTAESDDESKLKDSGFTADDTIVKPVETKALREKIHKILSPRR